MQISSIIGSSTSAAAQARLSSEQGAEQVESFRDALMSATEAGDHGLIMKAAIEFESFFLSQMFKEMRKSVDLFAPNGRSNAMEIYQTWFDEKVADLAARGNWTVDMDVSLKSNGIGLANFIFRQMTMYSETIDVSRLAEALKVINNIAADDEDLDE
jgi:Rod binding domain-containing protein